MQKVLKGIFSFVILIFLIYVGYRNINLRKIPSVDLVKDEQTAKLYNKVLPNSMNGFWNNYYYSHQTLKSEDVPDEIKFNAAYKSVNTSNNMIKEETLKNSYERIFGINTYKRVESFVGGCNTYNYDLSTAGYVKTTSKVCQPLNISILSKIVDAKEEKDNLEIDVVIAYIDRTNKIVYQECSDDLSTCSNIIEKEIAEFDEANLDTKKYDLLKYKFTFKIVNDEYYFDSVRKLK